MKIKNEIRTVDISIKFKVKTKFKYSDHIATKQLS